MLPVLRLFSEGSKSVSHCLPALKDQFRISDDEAAELIPSGRVTVLQSRAHWARTYLSKAGLLESPKRNVHVITERGRMLLDRNPARIDNSTLNEFEEFAEWRRQSLRVARPESDPETESGAEETHRVSIEPEDGHETPEDAMENANALLNAALRDELLALLQRMSPVHFERMILDLLGAMGYGGGIRSNGRVTKLSGDGGIDGIIDEDALGLDAVYVQAKRYASDYKVGRPDLQRFVGSLTGEGAAKGVFVTTSDYSRDAVDYVNRVQHRIQLINGQRLAALMIQYGVGVRTRTTYHICSIDEDYFSGVE